ncbi:MAG: hypothetical protein SPL73_03455 [Cyanobacteriota bacterium]|nr:hypothetical protein [Cyanobacteriota bacterium]MDY6359339.1 hypothetical protein [Cyanobacteriota bacterium]MDY6363927.1 hypothetical protein [Cyanobacteriota bacterium]
MDKIIDIIKYLIDTNIVNFALMVWFFWWVFDKIDIKKLMNNVVQAVKDKIQKSESEKESSNISMNKALETLNKLPDEIKEIEKFNNDKTELFKKQLEISTQKTIDKIENNIEKSIKIEEKNISKEVMNETIEKSIEQARNNIIEMLKSNPDLHNKFIQDGLDKLNKAEL